MGNRDALEQLEAAKQECVRLERELAGAQAVIEKARALTASGRCSPGKDAAVYDILATAPTDALAARDAETRRQALADGWDEGRNSAADEVEWHYQHSRKGSGIWATGTPQNSDIQPIRDAIDATGIATVNQYNSFIQWVLASTIAEELRDTDGLNPHRPLANKGTDA